MKTSCIFGGKNANICLQKYVLTLTVQQFQQSFEKQKEHVWSHLLNLPTSLCNKSPKKGLSLNSKGLVPVLCSFDGKSKLKPSPCAPRKMRRSTRGERGLWRWTCCRAMASKHVSKVLVRQRWSPCFLMFFAHSLDMCCYDSWTKNQNDIIRPADFGVGFS